MSVFPLTRLRRFRRVIETYQTTEQIPEALLRLTEAYLNLGIREEAQQSAAVLGYNYPGSPWYKDAYALLQKEGLEPSGDKGWFGRNFGSIF